MNQHKFTFGQMFLRWFHFQVFSSSGLFLKKFGSGEFEKPSGICTTAEGLIVVVDAGNSRVRLF